MTEALRYFKIKDKEYIQEKRLVTNDSIYNRLLQLLFL